MELQENPMRRQGNAAEGRRAVRGDGPTNARKVAGPAPSTPSAPPASQAARRSGQLATGAEGRSRFGPRGPARALDPVTAC
jgi:hypothetical protein